MIPLILSCIALLWLACVIWLTKRIQRLENVRSSTCVMMKDGELFFRKVGDQEVQLTNGGSLIPPHRRPDFMAAQQPPSPAAKPQGVLIAIGAAQNAIPLQNAYPSAKCPACKKPLGEGVISWLPKVGSFHPACVNGGA